MNGLFLSLSRAGWGEAAFGIHLARQSLKNGVRPVFLAHQNLSPLFSKAPFQTHYFITEMAGLLELFIEDIIREEKIEFIVLADFFTTAATLKTMGSSIDLLHKFSLPVIPVDTWDHQRSGFAIDMFVDKKKMINPGLRNFSATRIIPCPIANINGDENLCNAMPVVSPISKSTISQVRAHLGIQKKEKMVLFCTAKWQNQSYNDENGNRVSAWMQDCLLHYFNQLPPNVKLVHIGPEELTQFRQTFSGRYTWLPQMQPSQFDFILNSTDLLLTANLSSSIIFKAILLGIPVVNLYNSIPAATIEEVFEKTGEKSSPSFAAVIQKALPVYPFYLWPLGFFYFLEDVLKDNMYLQAIVHTEILNEAAVLDSLNRYLFDAGAIAALKERQNNYVSLVSLLPSPERLLMNHLENIFHGVAVK